jgi:transcriptional regulator NrdR family protein
MSIDCPKCGEELFAIKGLCTDIDEIREDRFCGECNTRYGTRSHGIVMISEAIDMSEVANENRELRITIKKMMVLKND